MKTRIFAILLVLALCLNLAACAGATVNTTGTTTGVTAGTSADTTTEVNVELPEYKVGVILYDLSNKWAKDIMKSIEYLGKELNIKFEYAVGGTDPEVTIAAVQNFGTAGCDGILNLHPGMIMPKLVEICEANEMFIVTSNDPANASADYATFSKNNYFAGEVWEDDFQTAYDIVTDMIKTKSAKTFALHGFPYGLAAQMDKRLDGARKAIADNGATIVTEGLSFDKAGAAQNIISQFPDVDAIFSSVETISTVYQPLINANLGGKILLNCYDPGEGAAEAMEEGTLSYAIDGTLADSMMAVVLLYNAMSGNRMTQADGSAASIQMNYVVAKTSEDFTDIQTLVSGDTTPYLIDEIKPFLTVYNKDASFDALKTFAGAFSLADVKTRHGN